MKRVLGLTLILGLGLLACAGPMNPDGDQSGAGDLPGSARDGGATDSGGGGDMKASGRTGLEGFCDHYKACGGSFYQDAAECIKATLNYWKSCRRPELDAFGDCMVAKVSCAGWNPDAYNPASTPCATEWSEVRAKMCN